MKILQIANGFPPVDRGGVETYTLALSRALRALGHNIAVFCREEGAGRPRYSVRDEVVEGIPVRRVANRFGPNTSFADRYYDPWIEALFVHWVEEQQPDVLHFQHTHGLSASLLTRAAKLRMPFTLTLHDFWYMCPQVNLLRPDQRLCAGSHHDVNCYECVYLKRRPPRGRHVPDLVTSLLATPPPAGSSEPVEPRPFSMSDSIYLPLRSILPGPVRKGLLNVYDVTRLHVVPAFSRPFEGRIPVDLRPARARATYMRETLTACPHITAPIHFVKDRYVDFGIPADHIVVLPPGMEMDIWAGAQPALRPLGDGLRFGYIGSLLSHKGVHVAIRAFQKLNAPDTELWIHGFELPNSAYTKELHALGDSDPRIHFAGAYTPPELPAILNRLDVLLIPSLSYESFSFVTREAVLAGLPVIASRMGGIPEAIEDGVNGLLLRPGDIDTWVAAMHRMVEDRELVAACHRAQSARKVKSMAEHAVELQQLYIEVKHTPFPEPS